MGDKKKSLETVLEEFKKTHGERYDYSLVVYQGTHIHVNIVCSEHGIFPQAPEHHKRGNNCPKCVLENSRYSLEKVIEDFIETHGDKYDYSKVNYINDGTKVDIICHEHGMFPQKPNNHKNGQGCPECFKIDRDEYINKMEIKHNFKYDYSKVALAFKTTDYIDIICPHHGIFSQNAHNHLNGDGCPECNWENSKLTSEEFIERSNIKHNFKFDYSKSIYIDSASKIDIICPHHGLFSQKANNHLNGKGCDKCKESKGEAKIRNYLINNNIKFITQKTFENCKYIQLLKFDFWIPFLNLLIEYDGEQHFNVIEFFGGEEGLKNNQIRDEIKNEFCKENNINLLRIKYTEINNIENILNKIFKPLDIIFSGYRFFI